jgi:hypothetical protein
MSKKDLKFTIISDSDKVIGYKSSAYYKLTRNGMKKLELRLVLIQDAIFGSSYQLRYVEID